MTVNLNVAPKNLQKAKHKSFMTLSSDKKVDEKIWCRQPLPKIRHNTQGIYNLDVLIVRHIIIISPFP